MINYAASFQIEDEVIKTEEYPYGKALDADPRTKKLGFPLKAAFVNDLLGAFQALLVAAGIEPSGQEEDAKESDVLRAIETVALNRIHPVGSCVLRLPGEGEPAEKYGGVWQLLALKGYLKISQAWDEAITLRDQTLPNITGALKDLTEFPIFRGITGTDSLSLTSFDKNYNVNKHYTVPENTARSLDKPDGIAFDASRSDPTYGRIGSKEVNPPHYLVQIWKRIDNPSHEDKGA